MHHGILGILDLRQKKMSLDPGDCGMWFLVGKQLWDLMDLGSCTKLMPLYLADHLHRNNFSGSLYLRAA